MKTLEPILAEHAFLKGLGAEHLKILTKCAANVKFDVGQMIFREGERANQFYLIRQGKVALEIASPHKDPVIIETIGEGNVLGWSWLTPPFAWHFDAHAQSLVRAIALDGKCLRGKFDGDHDLGYELYKRFFPIITDRLQQTRIQLMDVYGTKASR